VTLAVICRMMAAISLWISFSVLAGGAPPAAGAAMVLSIAPRDAHGICAATAEE
jgi:hypothetical protein